MQRCAEGFNSGAKGLMFTINTVLPVTLTELGEQRLAERCPWAGGSTFNNQTL
jgi:hypothetical protein